MKTRFALIALGTTAAFFPASAQDVRSFSDLWAIIRSRSNAQKAAALETQAASISERISRQHR